MEPGSPAPLSIINHFQTIALTEDLAMTQTENRKDFNFDYLLHPARAFRTPLQVVEDSDLTVYEKRAILASWASDACAVEDSPDLRTPPNAPQVSFDEIMDALKTLDGEVAEQPQYAKFFDRAQRWKDLYKKDRPGRSLLC
jgi:hypothetical protein